MKKISSNVISKVFPVVGTHDSIKFDSYRLIIALLDECLNLKNYITQIANILDVDKIYEDLYHNTLFIYGEIKGEIKVNNNVIVVSENYNEEKGEIKEMNLFGIGRKTRARNSEINKE